MGVEVQMKKIRLRLRPVSMFMAMLMVLICMPWQSAMAAMVGTEAVIDSARAEKARAAISKLLAREDIQHALIAQGIDPLEAQARVDSLSDREAIRFADRVEQLPAAGSSVAWVLGLAVLVFLVLLITDILGYTDIFPFVKKKA
jgi:hypothetical protein